MSRTSVGDVYARVIKEVCESSRIDFEEGGVEASTLELLKTEWQKKLSGLKIAQLPWDPTPTPAKEPTLPSNAKAIPQTLPSNGTVSTPPSSHSTPLPQVKHESQPIQAQAGPAYSLPQFPQGQPMSAQHQAAMNLAQRYGARAGPQIAQLQQSGQPGRPVPQSMPQPVPQQTNYIKQEDTKSSLPSMPDYSPEVSQQPLPIKASQTDGASDALEDWQTEIGTRRDLIARNRHAGDRLMKEHFLASQQELEAGGLMVPLESRHIASKATRRKLAQLSAPGSSATKYGSTGFEDEAVSTLPGAQGDAAGDEDDSPEADEDAINSDLDDPDEAAMNEKDEENTDQVMLCTYDKVQRVKNKWKCTLKDGVLRVEGSEYVFHKGQGEFEW